MMRSVGVLALLAPALLVTTPPAHAAAPLMCGAWRVTIDLNDHDAPDPDRARSDVVLGTPRGDVIRTGGGDDVVCAGRGADRVFLGDGKDTGYGGRGDDLLDGGGRVDHLSGGAGDDLLRGREGWDQLEDSLLTPGNDRVYGGVGRDTFRHANPGDVYFGGDDRDFFAVPAECDACDGVITYLGGPGNDLASTGTGAEAFDGEDGVDTVSYVNLAGLGDPGVTVDLAIAGPQDTGPGGADTLGSVEDLVGSYSGADLLYGDDGPNRIAGLGGADQLYGRGGDDDLEGGEQADLCDGGEGTNAYQDCEEIL